MKQYQSSFFTRITLVFLFCSTPICLLAQSWDQIAKKLPQDGSPGDVFGDEVAIYGDYAIVGASGKDYSPDSTSQGAVYVFKKENDEWRLVERLINPDSTNAQFGASVAMSENFAIVGAPRSSQGELFAGAVYIYYRNGDNYVLRDIVVDSDTTNSNRFDLFGADVAINEDYAVVGNYGDQPDVSGDRKGSVTIFRRDGLNWVEDSKITSTDIAISDQFGWSVSISEQNQIIVGANGRNGVQGVAYIFSLQSGNWVQQTRLEPTDLDEVDSFGFSVSISGDYAVVGAPGQSNQDIDDGAAYVFRQVNGTWVQQTKLLASDGALRDFFGIRVDIDGDYIVVNGGGAAYVYHLIADAWVEEQKVINESPDISGFFEIDLHGDQLILAAGSSSNGANSGAISIFQREGIIWSLVDNIGAEIPADGDNFGLALDIDGNYAIVGAPSDFLASGVQGAAYIYRREGNDWVQEAKLTADDLSGGDDFGRSVAIHGNRVVVGAFSANASDSVRSTGAAYVFRRDGLEWIKEAKLVASDTMDLSFDLFGWSVDIYEDVVVVGAYRADRRTFTDTTFNTGAVYTFFRDGDEWLSGIKYTPEEAQTGDRFGIEIAIDENFFVAGADFDNTFGNGAGAAYIYQRSGFALFNPTKIIAQDVNPQDRFGFSVNISGDYALIGSPFDSDMLEGAGAAYVFHREGTSWTQEAKLTASDVSLLSFFGADVSIDGDLAVVGAQESDQLGTNSGSAYVYRRSGTVWTEEAILFGDDTEAEDKFGLEVSVDRENLLIGAPFDNDHGENAGSAYFFSLNATSLTFNVSSATTNGESTVIVPITVSNFENIAGFQFQITYPTEFLDLHGVSDLSGLINNFPDNSIQIQEIEDGLINVLWFDATNQNRSIENGTSIIELEFAFTGLLGETAEVCVINPSASNNIPMTLSASGSCGGIEGVVTYNLSGTVNSPSGQNIPLTQINLQGAQESTVTTDAQGNYILENLSPTASYMLTPQKLEAAIEGVNSADLTLLSSYLLNPTSLNDPYQIIAADVNQNNVVDLNDLIILNRVVLGILTEFPDGISWRFVPEDYVFADPSNPLAEDFPNRITVSSLSQDFSELDFIGIKLGDINQDYSQNVSFISKNVELNTPDLQGLPGDKINIPIISGSQFTDIQAWQGTFSYDPEVLRYEGWQTANISLQANNFNEQSADEGQLNFVYYPINNQEENHPEGMELFSLQFTILGDLGTETQLDFESENTITLAYNSNLEAHRLIFNPGTILIDKATSLEGYLGFSEQVSVFPNPSQGDSQVSFVNQKGERLHISIIDQAGKVIHKMDKYFSEGKHTLSLDLKNQKGGVYFMRIDGQEIHAVKKILLIH